jgi:hypothetical protein
VVVYVDFFLACVNRRVGVAGTVVGLGAA